MPLKAKRKKMRWHLIPSGMQSYVFNNFFLLNIAVWRLQSCNKFPPWIETVFYRNKFQMVHPQTNISLTYQYHLDKGISSFYKG